MKRILSFLLIPGLYLTSCSVVSNALPPHLSVSRLDVTVHNPMNTALTGDPSRQNDGVTVTVDGVQIRPAPGFACTAMNVETGVRWGCIVPDVAAKSTFKVEFLATGDDAVIVDAQGSGYLGSPLLVPLVRLP